MSISRIIDAISIFRLSYLESSTITIAGVSVPRKRQFHNRSIIREIILCLLLPVSLKIPTFRLSFPQTPIVSREIFYSWKEVFSEIFVVSLGIFIDHSLSRILPYDNLEFLLNCHQRFISRMVKASLAYPSWYAWVQIPESTIATENLLDLKMSGEVLDLTISPASTRLLLISVTRTFVTLKPRVTIFRCHEPRLILSHILRIVTYPPLKNLVILTVLWG